MELSKIFLVNKLLIRVFMTSFFGNFQTIKIPTKTFVYKNTTYTYNCFKFEITK